MALHRGQGRGWQDVRPPVVRFEYMDRMDEEDDAAVADQRVEAWRASLPPVKPDRLFEVNGARIPVYTGEGERELRRREARLAKLREGRGSR